MIEAIAAGAGGAASLVGGIYAADQARKSANKQMRFQQYMSNTAHQREVADLRKAGLNPILSATGGAGSSTPSGSQYSVDSDIGTKAAGKIFEQAMNSATINNIKEDNLLKKAQAEQAHSAAALNHAERNILGPKSTINRVIEKVIKKFETNAAPIIKEKIDDYNHLKGRP